MGGKRVAHRSQLRQLGDGVGDVLLPVGIKRLLWEVEPDTNKMLSVHLTCWRQMGRLFRSLSVGRLFCSLSGHAERSVCAISASRTGPSPALSSRQFATRAMRSVSCTGRRSGSIMEPLSSSRFAAKWLCGTRVSLVVQRTRDKQKGKEQRRRRGRASEVLTN